MIQRMLGAALFNVHTFEEVERDTGATLQAAFVVILVSIASGIGAIGISDRNVVVLIVVGIINGIFQWAIWSYLTYFIGTNFFSTPQTHATVGQLARTVGFAQSPGILAVLGIIPALGGAILFLLAVWKFVAVVVAVRQALDYDSTLRALGVVLIGFVIILIVNFIIALLL